MAGELLNLGDVVANFRADTSGFQKAIKKAVSTIDGMGKEMKRSEGIMRSHVSVLDGVGKKVVGLAAAYVGFKAIGGFIGDATRKFNEHQQAATSLSTVILNQTGATYDNVRALMEQADALSNVSIFSKEQIMTAQATIATFDGMTAELTAKAIPAWMNYTAQQYGVIDSLGEAKQAAEAFGKATVGSMDALTKQGFKFTEAQKQIFETGNAQDRLNVVIEAMTYASSAAADQANTFEGRMKILQNQFDNTQYAVGGMAQMLKVELLNAFISSSGSGEVWGDNMLSIMKQVAGGIVEGARIAGQAIIGIMSLANRAAVAVQGVKAAGLSASEKFASDKGGIMGFLGKYWLGEKRNTEQIQNEIANVGESVLQLDDEQRKLGESSLALDERLGGVSDKIQGLKSITDLLEQGMNKAARGVRNMADEGGALEGASKKAKDAAEKEAKAMETLRDKVRKMKESYTEMRQSAVEALADQKSALRDLKVEYEKTVASIRQRMDELNDSFARNERSARESFLGQVASAADTARETIKEREAMIQTELNKGDAADMSKVASMQAQNEKERAELAKHEKLISEAETAEERKRSAFGLTDLISRYNEERRLARENHEREMADLNTQLQEKETAYKESSAKITADTELTLANLKKKFLQTYDDLFKQLKEKLKSNADTLAMISSVGILGASKDALAAFNKVMGGLKGFATGGQFVVGGAGGVDSNLVAFRASRGETVTVTPPGKSVSNTVNFGDITVRDNNDLRRIIEAVDQHLGNQSVTRRFGVG